MIVDTAPSPAVLVLTARRQVWSDKRQGAQEAGDNAEFELCERLVKEYDELLLAVALAERSTGNA